MRIVIDCISDLHGNFPNLEGGDLLIVAGDLTAKHSLAEFEGFIRWINSQKYSKKIVVAGNHDTFLESADRAMLKWAINCEYLCDSGTEFEGLKIWGSPWTKWFHGVNPRCKAFMLHSEADLAKKWALIPEDTDILITHSPPYRIFDEVAPRMTYYDFIEEPEKEDPNKGSISLAEELETTLKPKLHIFGHIHEHGGKQLVLKRAGIGTENNTICVNASIVNEKYRHVNKPVRIFL